MVFIMFIVVIVILILILILVILGILSLKRSLDKEIEKNSILNKSHIENTIKINAIMKINNNMRESIENLNKRINKNETNIKSEIICDLEEQLINIDDLLNNNSGTQTIKGNFKDELKQVIKNVDSKIELKFPDNLDIEVVYDKSLLLAIKLLLLKSIKISKKNKLKLVVYNVSKTNINIRIENINLVCNMSDLQPIGALLNINKNPFDLVDCKVDSDFMIIRQNLIHSAKSSIVQVHKKQVDLVITIEPEKLKRKRENIMALVVDDNKPTAQLNQEILNEIGVDSKAVYSAEECMREILTTFDQYDIIITDNQMPGKNGTDLIRDLRKIDGFNLPVIILTGDSGQSDYFLHSCGFNGYIEKPLDKKKALQTIKKLIKEFN